MSNVMTNLGPRSRKLDPINFDVSTSFTDMDGKSAPSNPLPPISRQSRGLHTSENAEIMEALVGSDENGMTSPARRNRKVSLLLSGRTGLTSNGMDGKGVDQGRSLVQASLVLDQKENEMSLSRHNKRDYGRVLLELWLNQVLDPSSASGSNTLPPAPVPGLPPGLEDPLKLQEGALKGLTSHGLTRVELINAGLSNESIDRLYRCMYVYTIGFFDVMQDILGHCEFRTEVLSNVWRGFLGIAENALQVQFKSDYLKLYQSQQVAMAELLFAKEQLAEARQDNVNTEKAIGWLTAAHAEERAQRQSLKLNLAEVQSALDRERVAHQSAVAKFVAEVEERSKLLKQQEILEERMQLAAAAQADLIVQRDSMRALFNQQQLSIKRLSEEVHSTMEALRMDELLELPKDLGDAIKGVTPSTAEAVAVYAKVVQTYSEQMYRMWRAESEKLQATAATLYGTRDTLRLTRLHEKQLETDLDRSRANHALLEKLKAQTDLELEEEKARVVDLDLRLSDASNTIQRYEVEIATLKNDLHDVRQHLAKTQLERSTLAVSLRHSEEDGKMKQREIDRLTDDNAGLMLNRKTLTNLLLMSLKAQSAAKTNLGQAKAKLAEQVKRASDLQWSLFRSERQARVLEGKLERSTADIQQLSLQCEEDREARKQAEAQVMGLQLDIENKKAYIETLQRQIDKTEAELQMAKEEIDSVNRRADEVEEQLEMAREEAQKLYASLQSLELQLEVMNEERGKLRQKIESMATERAEAEKLAKQRQEMLQMELNTRNSEIAQLKQQAQIMSAQIDTAKNDAEDLKDTLERKRKKKRRWKALASQHQQQVNTMKGLLEDRENELAALSRRVDPLEVDVAILMADRGRVISAGADDPESGTDGEGGRDGEASPGDIQDTYRAWDEAQRQLQETQAKLDAQAKALEAAREEHERARLQFYRSPTDEGLKTAMLGIEAVRAKIRAERMETESALDEIRAGMTKLQSAIRQFENAAFNRRLRIVRKRTNRLDLSLQGELSKRLDELTARARRLQERLIGSEEAVSRLNQRIGKQDRDLAAQEEEMKDLAERLRKTLEVKVELEKQLTQYRNMNTYLQTEMANVTSERDGLKESLAEVEAQLEQTSKDLADASNNLAQNIKRVESKWLEEKELLVEASQSQKMVLEGEVQDQMAKVKELNKALDQVEAGAASLLNYVLDDLERKPDPQFMWHFQVPPPMLAAEKVLRKPPPPITNFNLDSDPLLEFLQPPLSTVMVVISQVYVDKMLMDSTAEENLLGGMTGPRESLETVLYNFFLSRFGCRPAAELHLAAFLLAVDRLRPQHPKVRVFGRLLGLPELPPSTPGLDDSDPNLKADVFRSNPLPAPAVEFYVACLNRIHARGGPLLNEASDGCSVVKCKVLAKTAREMVRGSFTTMSEAVGSTHEVIRHMALNDEEKAVDLELALELMLQSFCHQYWEDFNSLSSMYRSTFDNLGRKLIAPDDLALFVRQVDVDRATTLQPMKLLEMFRKAMRASGPRNDKLGSSICHALLDSGFVGISSHRTRLETIKSLPPYDEFRLLEGSWRKLRVAVDHQTQVIRTRQESIRCDLPGYVDLAKRLDDLINSKDNPGVAWSTYRR
eukprot:CAMPEP_0175045938 /NCGR_PEP_ID=MMETSP0052_2-20121109/4740_1 /TAXON_ID=51329 ORGANISM="Polytomella parva, Strain SAG 63-3" /NCGR_SAMPLE_ID=MMETSP0052_2 /ASSEMBLY_ACC=CAM_ASM_000194 /LENGTH=1610 /DNA_ID=CAMNT_0016309603 /DNA_START=156 /DNA_END=4985 /DNA_ORIENTATION=+